MRPRLLVRSAAFLFGALGLTATLSGCDSAPGIGDLIANPPTLSDFSFSPLAFEHTGSSDTAQIPLQLGVTVANPAGGGLTVDYFVRRQFNNELVAQGTLSGAAGGGRYTGEETVSVPRGEIGMYVITVTVVDDRGNVGNIVTGLLRFASENLGTPVIEDVEFPPTVTRPAEDEPPVLVPVIATVSDPDGLGNITSVFTSTGGTDFEMLDDGGLGSISGDEIAGDGRYTVTFQIKSMNSGNDLDLTLQAIDAFGSESEVVAITIIVE